MHFVLFPLMDRLLGCNKSHWIDKSSCICFKINASYTPTVNIQLNTSLKNNGTVLSFLQLIG